MIYYVAPDGKKEAKGATLSDPTTIEEAIVRVKTGDIIIMRGGTYRTGNLILNQGITIQPYSDEQPVMKGAYVADKWRSLGNGLWTTKWEYLFPSKPANWWQRDRNGKSTPIHRFNDDMVFVDGKYLQSAGYEGEVDNNSFYIDYESGLVYIGADPEDKLVEITAFNIALHRITGECNGKISDHKGPVIKGITFTQYAYRAIEVDGKEPEGISPEAEHGKDVVGTTLEHCTISFCSRVAAYLRGDKLTIRNCRISDTSTEGIYIIASSDVLLEKNIFTRNNIEEIYGYYPAAVKIFNQSYRVKCVDNLVTDLPHSNGIWYDVGNVDGLFLNNRVEGVGSSSKMYQNTLINSTACISRSERSAVGDRFGWHPATGPDVDKREGHVFVNNLLTGDKDFSKPLLYVWQRRMLCEKLPNPQLKQLDYNVYVQSTDRINVPMILWSPAKNDTCIIGLDSPAGLHKLHPEFSAHSSLFLDYSVFMSTEIGNYRLIPAFPGAKAASVLPSEISTLLKRPKKDTPYIGAYPMVM